MQPFDYEGTEEPDTSINEWDEAETLDTFDVFTDCDDFDDKDIY